MAEKISLSFKEISAALHRFSLPSADLVIGIGRGGIVPASLVAHQLRCGLHIVQVNYRDDDNQPARVQPEFLQDFSLNIEKNQKILLVDDVAVSGKTLEVVKDKLKAHTVQTFVLKGKADYVLFPDIKTCVNWPWKEPITHVDVV